MSREVQARDLLAGVAREYHPVALAASLSIEDMVLIDMISRERLPIGAFMLDTGRLHGDTLDLVGRIERRYGIAVQIYQPRPQAVSEYVVRFGRDAFYESADLRRQCCAIRKVEPLRRALAGKQAWISGMRRAQSPLRTGVAVEGFDEVHGLRKFNPLAQWSEDETWSYLRRYEVPYNPLYDQGYRSIGCAPCTRPVVAGEEARAGRWWWEESEKKNADCIGMKFERSHLDWLESEAIHILREVAGESANPVLFFSGGKDSIVLLRLAEKAFRPARFPFPLLHIDTGHNFDEVIAFRDARAAELGERLIVRSVEDSIRRGTVRLHSKEQSRNAAQSITLLEAIAEFGFDAAIGGARRDEEKARAKERVFSFRDEFGQWDPKNQRPELWNLYNTRVHRGEHVRVFPISNWTELDIWQYIGRERLAVPSIYYAHRRQVVRRNGFLFIPGPEEKGEELSVRFRTVGDISCTCPVESDAANVASIIEETIGSELTERGATRMDDQTSEASMERRKKEGYF